MKAHPDWVVLNRGVNGERSDEIRARFARDVLAVRPAYAILLAGVNDVYQGRLPQDVQGNLAPMYAEAIDADIVPVAATVLTYDTATDRDTVAIREVNRWIRMTAATLDFPFADTAAAVADPRDPRKLRRSPDGLHPDVDGYRRMGEALAASIEADLRRRGRA